MLIMSVGFKSGGFGVMLIAVMSPWLMGMCSYDVGGSFLLLMYIADLGGVFVLMVGSISVHD